jgi:hypothetical protein
MAVNEARKKEPPMKVAHRLGWELRAYDVRLADRDDRISGYRNGAVADYAPLLIHRENGAVVQDQRSGFFRT